MKNTALDISQKLNIDHYSLLSSVTTTLTSSLNLKDTLIQILDTISSSIPLNKAIIGLGDPKKHKMMFEIGYGLSETDLKKKSMAQLKENVVQMCEQDTFVKSEQDIKISKHFETLFVDDETYFVFPFILGNDIFGSMALSFESDDFNSGTPEFQIFLIVSLLIAQEIKLKRLMEIETKALKSKNIELQDELKQKYNIHNMIGNCQEIQKVYHSIKQVAPSNATVLISGESGTGKELVAHAIHYNSERLKGPFIKINCGAIPETLIESELFGYEKGAFTDAHQNKIGKIEAANGGTLFLDEIGELPLNMQVKLLRVIQEKEFTRIGAVASTKVNLRVVAATNKDLVKEVEAGTFRNDLFYRLNVFPIQVPSLKDRQGDIALLVDFFIKKYSEENNKSIKNISNFALDLLCHYEWPGNVRELENCIERAIILCEGELIQASHLPPNLQISETVKNTDENAQLDLKELVNKFEGEIICDALTRFRGNRSKVADYLNTTQRIIGYKIDQLNIDVKSFKSK